MVKYSAGVGSDVFNPKFADVFEMQKKKNKGREKKLCFITQKDINFFFELSRIPVKIVT